MPPPQSTHTPPVLIIDVRKGEQHVKVSLDIVTEISPVPPIPVKKHHHIGHVTPCPPYTNTLVWDSILLHSKKFLWLKHHSRFTLKANI